MQFRAREVVHSPEFEEQGRLLEPDARRLDSGLEGVIWSIAQDPEQYWAVEGTPYRIAFTLQQPDFPIVRVLFRIDRADRCTLVGISVA